MSLLERHTRTRVARILGPILSVVILGTLTACTPPLDGNSMTSGDSSSAIMEPSLPAMQPSSAVTQDSAYENGTYSAAGVYRSPAGGEQVHVTLTIQNDIVTDATFSGDATHAKSKAMQAAFASGFSAQVVGKSLDQVNVGVVNGSSLTGIGFMEAVSKIKAQARS